jgi:outer membrane lipoprotein SlyB
MRRVQLSVAAAAVLSLFLAACQKGEQAQPAVTISVSPGTVKVGESANLTWSATNATTCAASGTWSGTQPTSGAIIVQTTAPGANAYTLMCTGPGGSAANTATLAINKAPAPVARAEPSQAPRSDSKGCADCGRVSAITPVKQAGEASGMGAVAGAVLGAVIGHQFGSGRGNSAATAGGAVAGGAGGYMAERAIRSKTVYQVTVEMEQGGSRKVTLANAEGIFIGAKVRVVGNDLELRE